MSCRVLILTSLLIPMTPAMAQTAGRTALLSAQDYPKEALRRHEEGTVRAKLRISADGHVANCIIVQSASPSLDAATCRILSERARFVPAKDRAGTPIEDDFITPPIRWQLPAPPPAPELKRRGVRM